MDYVKQSLGIEIQNIECCEKALSGTSMSQVVDRIVLDKMQFLYFFQPVQQICHNTRIIYQ
jgi:hypothetical protein